MAIIYVKYFLSKWEMVEVGAVTQVGGKGEEGEGSVELVVGEFEVDIMLVSLNFFTKSD